jgi:hypothetical protein
MDLDPVLCVVSTQILQGLVPAPYLVENVRYVLGYEDVARIAEVHHPLSDVDAPTYYIRVLFDVSVPADRACV